MWRESPGLCLNERANRRHLKLGKTGRNNPYEAHRQLSGRPRAHFPSIECGLLLRRGGRWRQRRRRRDDRWRDDGR